MLSSVFILLESMFYIQLGAIFTNIILEVIIYFCHLLYSTEIFYLLYNIYFNLEKMEVLYLSQRNFMWQTLISVSTKYFDLMTPTF